MHQEHSFLVLVVTSRTKAADVRSPRGSGHVDVRLFSESCRAQDLMYIPGHDPKSYLDMIQGVERRAIPLFGLPVLCWQLPKLTSLLPSAKA